jgi:hypothetical protein
MARRVFIPLIPTYSLKADGSVYQYKQCGVPLLPLTLFTIFLHSSNNTANGSIRTVELFKKNTYSLNSDILGDIVKHIFDIYIK